MSNMKKISLKEELRKLKEEKICNWNYKKEIKSGNRDLFPLKKKSCIEN